MFGRSWVPFLSGTQILLCPMLVSCRLIHHSQGNILMIRSALLSTGCTIQPALFLEIRKVLSKLSKEKGCESIAEWIRSCENHLYWSATTTFSGNGKVIWAKFSSFMGHIINKHSQLGDALFNKCFHGVISPRKWLKVGMLLNNLYDSLRIA